MEGGTCILQKRRKGRENGIGDVKQEAFPQTTADSIPLHGAAEVGRQAARGKWFRKRKGGGGGGNEKEDQRRVLFDEKCDTRHRLQDRVNQFTAERLEQV